ncbi:MAG: glycoside hydrolase family 127 protein, partial [Candidatus Omnitrophota bacterium]|nr:glycoside hydrolase family 127 protein [Candidatus Omnitrophota bacterium]
ETIQDISLELPVTTASAATFLTADDDGAVSMPLTSPITITQTAHDSYELLQGGRAARQGQHSEGWILVQNQQAGVMVGMRDAWQQYPKTFIADPKAGRLLVKLWPESAGELDLQTGPEAFGPDDVARGSAFGLGKTHELVFGFLGAAVEPDIARAIAGLWQSPWVLAADPAWLEATDAWGAIAPPASPGASGDADTMLEQLFDWAQRQPKRSGWYGMLNYGDTLAWYRNRDDNQSYDSWGWHPVGRWGWFGCEMMGTHTGALMSFLRTHDLKYFLFGEASARHIMDVDTVHYNTAANDPRLLAKINDTFSKVGSMHRHSAYHWSGRNEETSHTNVTGLLMYYYLTGYDRAWDVANEVGSFFLLDPVTYTQHPDIAPARNLGNILWGDVLMYQATGDARYKTGADRWAKVLLNGQRTDGLWLETYNPRDRMWAGRVKNNYLTFYVLQALIAYHRLTGDEATARAIVRCTDALITREQERQFFDALAYSYLLTGNPRYLEEGKRRVAVQMKAQQHTGDPLTDGMIFEKAIYERVPPVLYQVPYFLGALDSPDFITLQKTIPNSELRTPPVPRPLHMTC